MNTHKWNILHKDKISSGEQLVKVLLKNRGISDVSEFLNPLHPSEFIKKDTFFRKLVKNNVSKAVELIRKAIKENQPIVIHGDYDADGQTATAILWRTIHNDLKYKKVFSYIPSRFSEGYGLTNKSLIKIKEMLQKRNFSITKDKPLLITVDCGIVSHREIKTAKAMGFSVIITDHHETKKDIHDADAVIHTKRAAGAGISWILSYKLISSAANKYVDLAAVGTICDLMTLTGFNRSIVKYGLETISKNPNLGLKILKETASIKEKITTYHVGWQLGPRLNATGRLENAIDSLHLLTTDSEQKAHKLAHKLEELNRKRQEKTQIDMNSAINEFENIKSDKMPEIIITHSENYHEGIIGLVAGKISQKYNRPAIAISIDRDKKIAKGSARSIKGISIISELRKISKYFDGLGGHEMAAGFSIKIENLHKMRTEVEKLSNGWDRSLFKKELKIDCALPTEFINISTYNEIQKLKPFGIGNPEPLFLTSNLIIHNMNRFGKENQHIKLFLKDRKARYFSAICFNPNEMIKKLNINDTIDIIYKMTLNNWNGQTHTNLKIQDIKKFESVS